ncbi:hypothetical protein Taro_023192, partial [Colocasia esculenta]|nr:hypothetical protein [Colocasia esculenta]
MRTPTWLSLASLLLAISSAAGVPVPAMFVFGDSLVDPGNNNRLVTLAKADYAPNGVDFPGGATGRFCNGRTVVDHLGELLGLPLIPPFHNPTTEGQRILHGVNYASASSGILNDTGKLFGDRFPMHEQMMNFQKTVQELSSQMGGGAAGELLQRSLFFVGMGNNDYINNYLLPFSGKPRKYTPEAYTQMLIQHYRGQLKNLYRLGGRRFLVAGVGPLGCIPNQIVHSGKDAGSCVSRTNGFSLLFNSDLNLMLQELNANLSGSHFLFWDTYSTTMDVISNFSHYGNAHAHLLAHSYILFPYTACCGEGRSKSKLACLPLLPLHCRNRSEYVFWDPYHPTDAFNAIAARQ